MTVTICLFANTLYCPRLGGHFWVYLNWALGLQALGCRVIWMEGVHADAAAEDVQQLVATLRGQLERYGLSESIALCSFSDQILATGATKGCLEQEAAAEADLLLTMGYWVPDVVVRRFRRSAMVDLDPGLTQIWMSEKQVCVAKHDLYFTIGETVGKPGSLIPDVGIEWHYTPPCVALDRWFPCRSIEQDAPFSTVSQWYGDEWVSWADETYYNDKREGFRPFLDLPRHTSQRLELALGLGDGDEEECTRMREIGWRVRDARTVTATPWDYQSYVQRARGEFTCVKPSCLRLQNAWMSDRTICYLATGKPAVVQNTGPSRFLPNAAGLFRFSTFQEAVRCVETVAADYEQQCRLARALAEEHFDASKNLATVLERALN